MWLKFLAQTHILRIWCRTTMICPSSVNTSSFLHHRPPQPAQRKQQSSLWACLRRWSAWQWSQCVARRLGGCACRTGSGKPHVTQRYSARDYTVSKIILDLRRSCWPNTIKSYTYFLLHTVGYNSRWIWTLWHGNNI